MLNLRFHIIAFSVVVLFAPLSGLAREQVCSDYLSLPDQNILEARADCDSVLYYYKLNGKEGDTEARKCAYRELKNKDVVFGGAAVLMMIYANGRGIPKDIDLAMKYACAFKSSPEELALRLKRLSGLRTKAGTFDVCDDVESEHMVRRCKRLHSQPEREETALRFSSIQKNWTPAEQKAFRALRQAFDDFVDERTNNEIDHSDGNRGRMIEAHDQLVSEFLEKIENFEHGKFPEGRADNRKDLQLNFKIITIQKKSDGTLTANGCRETQKSWIKYLSAWLAFAKVRYPKLSLLNLHRELTAERITQLEKLRVDFAK